MNPDTINDIKVRALSSTLMVYPGLIDDLGENVIFEEIDMSKAENREKYGFGWRLYINGENLFTGIPPSYEQIRAKIKQLTET